MAEVNFNINGIDVPPPIQWQDIKLIAAWINTNGIDGASPSITGDSLNWEREAAEEIQRHLSAGVTGGAGIFQNPSLKITASDSTGVNEVFNGHIDFNKGLRILRENRVECGITKPEDWDVVGEKLRAITYSLLKEKGEITAADYTEVKYVVLKDGDELNLLWLVLSLYFLSTQIVDSLERVQQQTARTVYAIFLASVGAAGASIATIAYNVVLLLLSLAYVAAIILAILKLINEVIGYIIPVPRIYKGMTLRKMLEKPLAHIGLALSSNIPELDKVVYLPSRTALSEPGIDDKDGFLGLARNRGGIPKVGDYGYSCAELFTLCMDMFNVFVKVDKGVCYFYPEGDAFWDKAGVYNLPDVLLEQPNNKRYNLEDVKNTQLFSFRTDPTDSWTVKEFTGTNIEIVTESSVNIPLPSRTLKGFYEKRFPVALAVRRKKFGRYEEQLVARLKDIDNAIKKLTGKKSNFASVIENSLNKMVTANKQWNVPKLVYQPNSGGIPYNYRDKFSARSLYNNYWICRSFAAPHIGQKILYDNVKIPFTLSDWNLLTTNAYFKLSDGRTGKFTSLEWVMGQNYAIASFWIREIYVKTVKETMIEP